MLDDAPRVGAQQIAARVLDAHDRLGLGYVFSDGSRILAANQEACRITRYTREELLALPDPFVLLPDTARERLRAELQERIRQGSGAWLVHTPLIRKGGTRAIVDIGACLTIPPMSDRVEVLAVFREVDREGAPASVPVPVPVDDGAENLLFREVVRGFLRASQLSPARLRSLGASIARTVVATDVDAALASFAKAGLGRLAVLDRLDGRYVFHGTDMAEHDTEKRSANCHVALGFLTRVVEAVTGHPAAGAEMMCASKGDPSCVFEVRWR